MSNLILMRGNRGGQKGRKSRDRRVDDLGDIKNLRNMKNQQATVPVDYTAMLQQNAEAESEDLEGNWLISYADMMTLLMGFFVMISSFSKIDNEVFEKARIETTKYFGGEYKRQLQQVKSDVESNISNQNLADQVHLDFDSKGVNVTFRGALFFDSGSSELRPDAIELIKKIVPSIKKVGTELLLIVEGHTDDNPINDFRFPSNWELSSYRASSVLRLLENLGFPKSQLRAIGFAETMPAFPNRDKNGKPIPENQNQNRRVVIRIIKQPQQ